MMIDYKVFYIVRNWNNQEWGKEGDISSSVNGTELCRYFLIDAVLESEVSNQTIEGVEYSQIISI